MTANDQWTRNDDGRADDSPATGSSTRTSTVTDTGTADRPSAGGPRRRRSLLTAAALATAAMTVAATVSGCSSGGSAGGSASGGAAGAGAAATAAGPSAGGDPSDGELSSLTMQASGTGTAEIAQRSTHAFTTVGATWDDPSTPMPGTLEVRTRSSATGQWSGWEQLSSEDADTAASETGADSRGGTEPRWVGPSNGVQARVRMSGGATASLPPGLRLVLVDPATEAARSSSTTGPGDSASAAPTGGTPAGSAVEAAPGNSQLPSLAQAYPSQCASSKNATKKYPSPLPGTTKSSVAMPHIVSRAGWGADECVRGTGYPDYAKTVKVVFVHHTDDPNNYSCADSPQLIRAAYIYHVKSEGWRDIGYNFLVDKCGTIFEGRFGGVALPVIGAQIYGLNTDSAGVAAIGAFTDTSGGDASKATTPGTKPTTAMLKSIAAIAKWKLSLGGFSPKGTNTLKEIGSRAKSGKFNHNQVVRFNNISGHRDGFATDCPGNQLYGALGQIRDFAAS